MIEDKRLIDSIINEFIIYKNKFNNEHMDDKQLFSIIMYKNICPKSYANLQKGKGNVVEIFKNKQIKLNKIIEELENQKSKLNNKKDEVKKECLKSIKELKFALISSIYNFDQYLNCEREFKFDNRTISINQFISSDIEMISNSTISFKTERYSYIHLDEDGVFRLFGNKCIFINRWKDIEKGKDLKLEEYKDYITLFVPGNLSKEDNEFFFAVKTGENLPYDYKLNNIKNTTMLKLFLELNDNGINEFEKKNLTIIMNCGNEIKEFVLENFEEYFNLCYSLNKSNEDEKR